MPSIAMKTIVLSSWFTLLLGVASVAGAEKTSAAAPLGLDDRQIQLQGSDLQLTFELKEKRLRLASLGRQSAPSLIFADPEGQKPGAGPVGNPLAVVVADGKYKGNYGPEAFQVTSLRASASRLVAYLQNDAMPLILEMEVRVEGNVVHWLGQGFWNGTEGVDADIYYPLLSRVILNGSDKDRAIMPEVSGSTQGPLRTVNFRRPRVGNMSMPVFLLDGGKRGLAFLDDNQADFAADPGATCMRSYVVANQFPMPLSERPVTGGASGPYVAVCHTRQFRPIADFGGEAAYSTAERSSRLPVKKLGDSVDLGPVRVCAYEGGWKAGALWLRTQRRAVPMRVSPAEWYRKTTFLAEDHTDNLLREGLSFYDLPKLLEQKRRLGADLFHLPGFHDPEIMGIDQSNWLNRGDYYYAAQNLGGFEAARSGIEAVHRSGGHILYYVEGMIMWKRSRIGRLHGAEWTLMQPDGSTEINYKGFYHMCPAVPEWQDWIAKTCAEILRTTGVDGFFIDSLFATDFHRCYNPAHHHPHPDVWTWGNRQLLKRIREEVDKVNPNTILVMEGCADIGREDADGFVSHTQFWMQNKFTVPFTRFIHADLRAYESWGYNEMNAKTMSPPAAHVWNSVQGYRIYSHNPKSELMVPHSLKTRHYYDAFPEICDNEMSELDVEATGGIAQLFEGKVRVMTVGNITANPAKVHLQLPVPAGLLFDRVTGTQVNVKQRAVDLELAPFEFRAFEIRF